MQLVKSLQVRQPAHVRYHDGRTALLRPIIHDRNVRLYRPEQHRVVAEVGPVMRYLVNVYEANLVGGSDELVFDVPS